VLCPVPVHPACRISPDAAEPARDDVRGIAIKRVFKLAFADNLLSNGQTSILKTFERNYLPG
jgi:hypothetical protein